MVTALQDCVLTWYIKYCVDNPHASLAESQTNLNKEFSKTKFEAQSVIEFKEILMRVGETPWDFDQRLKCKIRQANMKISYTQHRDWFIASLLPHLRIALSQQKIATQAEALEIMMRLHTSPIQDTNLGVQHIHSQLASIHLELQILKKESETKPEVHVEV